GETKPNILSLARARSRHADQHRTVRRGTSLVTPGHSSVLLPINSMGGRLALLPVDGQSSRAWPKGRLPPTGRKTTQTGLGLCVGLRFELCDLELERQRPHDLARRRRDPGGADDRRDRREDTPDPVRIDLEVTRSLEVEGIGN